MATGFPRRDLRHRYDVTWIEEDAWHTHSGETTSRLVARVLDTPNSASEYLLNAGAGVYRLAHHAWREIELDLFDAPLRRRPMAVCGSVEILPFARSTFGAVVCVGEVLAYCDPATAIAEFSRVLVNDGALVIDFRTSRSPRYWFRKEYGRAADIIVDDYNGRPERTWIYDVHYVRRLLERSGFTVRQVVGVHKWSSIAMRLNAPASLALRLEQGLRQLPLPNRLADLVTIVASRVGNGSESP